MDNDFNFLDLNSNDELCKLKYDDTLQLIENLRTFKLSLRDTLNLDRIITFGLEIEFENIICRYRILKSKFSKIKLFPSTCLNEENLAALKDHNKVNKYWNEIGTAEKYVGIKPSEVFYWDIKHDFSLNNGAEITSPILIDEKYYWEDLKKVCDFIKKYGEISTHSAGHIHIGCQTLGISKTPLLNLIKLWSVYENVIYRFGYNEYLTVNPGIAHCAHSSSKFSYIYELFKGDNKVEKLINFLSADNYRLNDLLNFLSDERAQAVNFQNVCINEGGVTPFGTIEFRSPNGTLDPVIWQNNVNFFAKMLLYCKSDKFDLDTIIKREEKLYGFDNYNYLFTEQAIELADMLFDNNLDKVYFLRQYIKDFDRSDISMKKTKKFTM